MSKKKDFLDKFKLKKALGDFKASINYGDKLHMFNCLYKVVSSQQDGYTILEDEKNSKFAIPSPKLALMMKKGLVKNHGLLNLSKAVTESGKIVSGVSKRAANAAHVSPSGTGKPGPHGEPVGTTKQGADGQWYKKVSDNPSKWVHVANGTAHSAPGSDAMHPLSHPEDQKRFMQIREVIKAKTDPAQHEKLENMAMEWVKQMHKFKNMQSANNMGDVDEGSGKKLPRTGLPEATVKNIMAEHDKAVELKQKLIKAIISAKKEK